MSVDKNRREAGRWLATAGQDLAAARVLHGSRMYSQSCFLCQQAGEKALKALWRLHDADPWGHSVQRLVEEFSGDLEAREEWINQAALLDKYYIPTRYPNGLPDLTPGEVYREDDSTRGLSSAEALISGVTRLLDA